MPIKLINLGRNKGKGYRYGKTGTFYPIKKFGRAGAYKKSLKQTQAIQVSKGRAKVISVKSTKRARGYIRKL